MIYSSFILCVVSLYSSLACFIRFVFYSIL